MTTLFITIDDIARLSSFDGNIDNDSINPFIFMAQNNEIKRSLGDDLYNKIATDLEAETLAGDYLSLYNDFIAPIHVYYTCGLYLQLAVPKVSQNGAYMVTPEKTEQLSAEERQKMADKYEKQAIGLETQMIEFLNASTLPEWPQPNNIKPKSSFNWIKI